MSDPGQAESEAFRRFIRRVWRDDVTPLLRDRADQRRKAARVTGRIAAGTGLAIDSLLRLRGRPFTRFMTVVGSSFGAMLPDVFDWSWLRSADVDAQRTMVDAARRRGADLGDAEALELFELGPGASVDDLKRAWHAMAHRWHPDRAPDEAARAEHHVRFVTYQAAYERLRAAYEAGRLPV